MPAIDNPEIEKIISQAKIDAGVPKPSPSEIRHAIADEAARREGTQRAMLIAGMVAAPMAEEMRTIALLDAGVRFMDACILTPNEVAKRLGGRR